MFIRRWKMLTGIGALLILTALVIGCSNTVLEPVAKNLPVAAVAVALLDEDEADHDEAVGMVSEEAHVDDHDADDDHDIDDADMIEIALGVIEGRNWGFDPPVIEVRVGTPVKLTLVNDGRAEHDVEIAALMAEHVAIIAGAENHEAAEGHHDMNVVAVHAIAGTTASVMFTPMEAGEYEYACTLPGHKEAGMVGTLIVTN